MNRSQYVAWVYSKCFLCVPFADCFFSLKVWNAQKAGAYAVLVADDIVEKLILR